MAAKTICLLVGGSLLFAAPAFGQGAVCLAMDGNYYGDFMVSPVQFSGPITAGDCAPGEWTVTVDDTGWPTDASRWDYIWNTFYAPNYDPSLGGVGGWLGIFDYPTLPSRPDLFIDHYGAGTMTGVIQLIFQVIDLNSNGILDNNEECSGGFAGLVIIINDGTGTYAGYCGSGSYSGGFFKNCPATDETWMMHMDLCIQPCETSVAEGTWGAIKAMMR